MKLHAFFLILLVFAVIPVFGQTNYSPVGNFTDAMNINLLEAKVNGVSLEKGDEIGVFDGGLCVGNAVLESSLENVLDVKTKSVVAGSDDTETSVKDGFKVGDTIKYKYWNASENIEIEFTEVKYYNPSNGNEISSRQFEIGATVYVSLNATYNYKPKSDAGSAQILYEGETGQLDGTGSIDLNGDSLTYFWSDLDTLGLEAFDEANPNFTAPKVTDDKVFRLVLIVSDGIYFSDPDTVLVTVLNVTSGPIANAGADTIKTFERDTVFLDGCKSFDPDGLPITYRWELSDNEINLENSDSCNVYFVAPEVTQERIIYAVLTVTNSTNNDHKDTVFITIKNENIAPVAVAVYSTEINEGEQYIIDGSNSNDPDDGPDNLTYRWRSLNGGNISNTNGDKTTFTAPWLLSDSTFYISLTVFDGDKYSTPDTVAIKVKHKNLQPVADAGVDIIVKEGDEVVLDGKTSFDPEGKTLLYEWTSDYLILDDTHASDPIFIAHEIHQDTSVFITLKVSDKEIWSEPDTIWVTIKNVNKTPEWVSLPADTAYLEKSYHGNIQVYDTDIYDTIQISTQDLPSWLKLTDFGNGTAELIADTIPNIDTFQGNWEFVIEASDGTALIDTTFVLHLAFFTGIEKYKESDFLVFPNPAHNWITIQFEDQTQSEKLIQLYNSLGVVVLKKAIDHNFTKICIEELPGGVYFLKIIEKDKTQQTLKLLVN